MKREEYVVSSPEFQSVIKYKWNDGVDLILKQIRELARREGAHYSSVLNRFNADHTVGKMVWQSSMTGKTVTFKIRRIKC